MTFNPLSTIFIAVLALAATNPASGFVSPTTKHSVSIRSVAPFSRSVISTNSNSKNNAFATTILHSSPNNGGGKNEYSREVRLRTEAESPFRKVRFFLYVAVGAGAMLSLLVSLTRIAAAASGINPELMSESLINAGVDLAGIIGLGFFYQNDAKAEESRMKRATKGASLAKLAIRVNKGIIDPLFAAPVDDSSGSTDSIYTSLTLADLRRDRGIEKRVVIVAAGKDKIQKVMEETKTYAKALERNDLLIVPVVMPAASAPDIMSLGDDALPSCVALPIGNTAWRSVLEDEAQTALQQDVNIETEGFCVILKKNGRVGQRTKGIFLERMVGEVEERRDMGMDVTNI